MAPDPAYAGPAALPEIERTLSALGAKIAAARAQKGWSLAELARRAGLSTGAVHKVEKSGMTPTIATLMKIAAALGTSVAHLVEEDSMPSALVVRGDERARLYTSKAGLGLENVSGRYGGFGMAGAQARMEAGASSGPEPMTHGGEELVIVQEGTMRFTVDGDVFDLGPGDSIHFRASRPHAWSNPSDRPAHGIWLVMRSS
jgi:transcriptional regulator with XRE-family HTH domain